MTLTMPHRRAPSLRQFKYLLPAAALLLLAVDPAMAANSGTGGNTLEPAVNLLNGLTGGVKGIVAIVGFIVALISLVALRSFAAVLFFLGLAIFGNVGVGIAMSLIGAPLALI